VNKIYLRKVVGFFPIWGFPRINLLCYFCLLFMLLLLSTGYIYVNVNEVKEHK
jgi:hypothetical protein